MDGWERIVTNESSAIYALLALKVALFNEQKYLIALAALEEDDTSSFTW
ncbi:hypothetical protein N8860_05400 [Alphaproteobacteria bacterium]|nr:hypothetical protein [Alphaproteobacteria bacterium]